MVHPVMVAHILADMRMDLVAMVTGLLHDVVEDTSVTVEAGPQGVRREVARCVDGVTKLSKLDVFSAEDRQAESFRKMLLAMVDDIRVIMVKLADRMHNMRHAGLSEPGAARAHRARDHRDLRAHRAPARHGKDSRRSCEDLAFQLPGAGSVRGDHEAPSNRKRAFQRGVPDRDPPDRGSRTAPRRHPGAQSKARVKRPYSVFQKLTPPEDHGGPGVRSAWRCASSPIR